MSQPLPAMPAAPIDAQPAAKKRKRSAQTVESDGTQTKKKTKAPSVKKKCPHDRIKYQCKECGGSGYCEHGRLKTRCKGCGGSDICPHDKRKYRCKLCNEKCEVKSVCAHGQRKEHCKECSPSNFCKHGRIKGRCKICGGGSLFCSHGKRKYDCVDCGGNSTCKEHGCIQRYCKICAGHMKCTEPCSNAGKLTIECRFGCNKIYICHDCKMSTVKRIGDKCKACNKGKTKRENYFEKYLREQADAGTIPLYTSWNCIDKERDVDQCSNAYRPDFTFVLAEKGLVVVVEFDEHQHHSYETSCELNRMLVINHSYMTSRAACIRWIRYNPDLFNVNERRMNVRAKERKAYFIKQLQLALSNVDYSHKIEIEYLFYNKTPEMDQTDPFNRTECFTDILDYHQWARRRLGETTDSGDSVDAFVAQQADSVKLKYIEAVANAASGGAMEGDSDGDEESDEDMV